MHTDLDLPGSAESSNHAITTVQGTYTYSDLCSVRDEIVELLVAVAPAGETVAVLTDWTRDSVACLLAVWSLHRPALLLPVTVPALELHTYLSSARISTLVVSRDVVAALPHTPLDNWTGTASSNHAAVYRSPHHTERDECASLIPRGSLLQLTSGSIDGPRIALRSRESMVAEINTLIDTLELAPPAVVVCASSIAHSYGCFGGLLAPLAAGCHTLLARDPDFLTSMQPRHFPSIVVALAPWYSECVRRPYDGRLDSARLLFSAGAPLPPELAGQFLAWCGHPIRQDYGTTEIGTIALDTHPVPSPRAVGAPLPHLQLRVSPSSPERPSNSGEILVRPPSAVSYIEGGRVVPITDAEGWYHTRDSGWLDADGLLHLGDRLRDPVTLGEASVDPTDLERLIQTIPGVREAAVVNSGVGAARAVLVAPGVDEQSLLRDLRRLLPGPLSTVELRDVLPRSPAGKLLYRYL
jgi:acyl-coenzyme A synthetase/AMP-(fatty) acid ligase